MLGQLVKSFLPRGLYGRTAMILVVPIVTIQLVLSIVFVQRHFDRVTQQMTAGVVAELTYVLTQIDLAPVAAAAQQDMSALLRVLSISVTPAARPAPQRVERRLRDIAGLTLVATMRAGLPGFRGADLRDSGWAMLWVETRHGMMQIRIPRARLSPSNPHQLLVIVLFAAVLMTFISFLFLRNQVRPIRRLAEAAEAFGKGWTQDYHPSGATEVRAAGRAFLDMRARIERQIAQRTLMLSGISHDMRTPLTRMRLALSMMDQADDVEALRSDIADLEALLDSFLDFARDQSADAPEPVDPAALVAEVVARRQSARGPVTLHATPPAPATAMLRPLLVARALDNLIGNALRYAGSAHVSLTQGPGELVLSVEDAGPGIPPAQRDEARLPFVRLDAARNQDRGGGVGLGLAIAEDAMRQHGGRLELDESPEHGGLRARLVLPR